MATGAVMAVVGPHLCGLGGDVLAMVGAPGSPPEALLAVGRAGRGPIRPRMRAEGMAVMPLRGDIRSVQVPGAVDGWLALHERYGRLPLDEVLAPAIELAADGFPASIMLALASHLVHELPGAGELCPDGPLEIGQRVRLPGHRPHAARRRRATAGRLLRGRVRPRTARARRRPLRSEDFATSAATWCAPLRLGAWGHDLWTVPPPSQGYLTLAGAAVAEAAGLGTDPDDPQWAHLLVESLARRRPRPARRALRRRRRDALLASRAVSTPPRPGSTASRAAPPDVAPGTARWAPPWPGRRRGHDAPVRHRRRRPRDLA